MRRGLVAVATFLLGACTSLPGVRNAPSLFDDNAFQPASTPIDGEAVFALSTPMRQYLDGEIAQRLRAEGSNLGLIGALQDSGRLNLEYDSSITRNASEAFAARTGNCMSLVILTSALARELGLEVQFQQVLGERVMSRDGDLVFYNGHVNVVLIEHRHKDGVMKDRKTAAVIDFLRTPERSRQRVKTVSRQTVIAMYMNNRAAEEIAAGRVDDAYWWARAAIRQEPHYTDTYNTLGVAYRHHGDMERAATALDYALQLEPGNTTAMSNLIPVLKTLGRTREAERWSSRLSELQAFAPFYFFDQGQAAMQRGEFAEARKLFAKEIERAAYYHEFHYWLALAYLGLHDTKLARKHFTIARDNATTRVDAATYQEALDGLGSVGPSSLIGNPH